MVSLRIAIAIIVLGSAFAALAQPNPFGCHYFRNAPRPAALSAAERDGIQDIIARSDTFDIVHYEIDLDVTDYSGQNIQAATTITFRALMDGLTLIRFDLVELQVDSVVGASGTLNFMQDDQNLTVYLPAAPPIGVDQLITVYYGGQPHRDPEWGGFCFEQGYIYNLGIGISTIPPNFGKVWYPCFDSFVERATYTFHVKSAGTYRFHGQGTFLGETQLEEDTVIRSYALDVPIPTHISAIAVADYAEHNYTHSAASGEIPVTLLAKPSKLQGMIDRFGDMGAAIDVCEHWYGDYPFDRVGYVHTVDGALEIPTNVAYPDFMNSQSVLSNRALYTHELGHHWWGDMVTPHVHNDMWLKEGPAEYSGHLVEEWLTGEEGLKKAVKDNLLYVLRQAHVNDEGFHALSPMPDEHIYGSHTYYKGALVMHNLRGYLGDSLFRHAMHMVQADLAHTTITPDQLKTAIEGHTQTDLTSFFNDWIYGPAYSVFEVRSAQSVQNGDQWDVQLQIGQKLRGGTGYHTNVPVDLTFVSASGEVHDQIVMLGNEITNITVSSPFEPRMISLNRNTRLNQARLDQEVISEAGNTFDENLPYVDVRTYCDGAPGDVLLRVEHLWVPPDPSPFGPDVVEISGTHYWNIDGIWEEGTALRVRFPYSGFLEGSLDHELFGGNEYGMCILYRPTAEDEWQVYADQVVNTGNLINGQGTVMVSALRKGQYALGKASGAISVGELDPADEWSLSIYPVPARDRITVEGNVPVAGNVIVDVIAADGRIVLREPFAANGRFSRSIDIARLSAGGYTLRAITTTGQVVGTGRFEKVH